MKSQFIKTNGIQLHCKVAGPDDGELVILLHGFPEFWYAWNKFIPPLAEKYKVVAPDLRGNNKSDSPKGLENYTLDKYLKDIVGLIDHFGGKAAKIVGHDWGGAIAWQLGHYYAEKVERLIILNSPHTTEFKKALKRNPFQMLKSHYMLWFQIPKLPDWLIFKNRKKFFRATFRGGSVTKDIYSDEFIDTYAETFSKKEKVKSAINIYRGVVGKPKALRQNMEGVEYRSKISCKVLLLWGVKDKYIGRELSFNTAHYCMRKPKTKYFPEASHWLHHEQPEKVLEQIEKFLNTKYSEVRFGQTAIDPTLPNPLQP